MRLLGRHPHSCLLYLWCRKVNVLPSLDNHTKTSLTLYSVQVLYLLFAIGKCMLRKFSLIAGLAGMKELQWQVFTTLLM